MLGREAGTQRSGVARAIRGLALLMIVVAGTGLTAASAGAEASDGINGAPRADAATLAAGADHTCVIVATGAVRCWGGNSFGQLGQGNIAPIGDTPGESTARVELGAGRTATAIAAGGSHTCAILDNGTLRCWGLNSNGELGQGNTTSIGDTTGETTVAVDLGPGRTAVAVTAGDNHTCAILDNGTVHCWGWNFYGQLGQGNTASIGDTTGETTVLVDLGPGRTAIAITAGGTHTCAILDNGALHCWGGNSLGQLGQGNKDAIGDTPGEHTVAVNLGAGRTATAVSAGQNHTCAILDDAALRCWGNGVLGQGNINNIGDDPGETTVPVDLGPGRTATAVAGSGHTCAILDKGTLRCWGFNSSGQLGLGNKDFIGETPGETTISVDLGVGRTAAAVVAGSNHTCVSFNDGTVRCWGSNGLGQLGQGSSLAFGGAAGETPNALPAIQLGGALAGRDSDGDGIRDAIDACPAAAGTLANGCPAPTPVPTPTPTPGPPNTPTPSPTPGLQAEAVLSGRKITVSTTLRRTASTKHCPKSATAKASLTTAGRKRVMGTAKLTVKAVTIAGQPRCKAAGTLKLNAAPPANSKVRITITGTGLKARTLIAVR